MLVFQQFTLGISSLSRLGSWGAGLQVVVLLYLYAASCTGLYGSGWPARMRPRTGRTPLPLLIANCALLLVFSSALPLLAKILGILCIYAKNKQQHKMPCGRIVVTIQNSDLFVWNFKFKKILSHRALYFHWLFQD